MVLLLRFRSAPADLNLNLRARAATVSAALLVVSMLLLPLAGYAQAIVPTLVLFLAAVICIPLTKDSDPGTVGTWWKSPVAFLIGILMPLLVLAWVGDPRALLPPVFVAVIIRAHSGFYQMVSKRAGIAFAIAVVPLQVVFFIGCALSILLGLLAWLRRR